jgi:hypothetical protein
VQFQIRVDNTAPIYSNLLINSTAINGINEMVEFSSLWADDYTGLKDYYFSWNITKNFENTTSKNFINNWANITKSISEPDYEGRTVASLFYSFDKNNNLRQTEPLYFQVINQSPYYSNVSQSGNIIAEGEIVNLSAYWTDNFNVYESILETNKTGVWSSQESMTLNSISTWSNYTFNTSGYKGKNIAWKISAGDNVKNINSTDEMIFSVI